MIQKILSILLLISFNLHGATTIGGAMMVKENMRKDDRSSSFFFGDARKELLIAPLPFFALKTRYISFRPMQISFTPMNPGPIGLSLDLAYQGDGHETYTLLKRRRSPFMGGTMRIIFLQLRYMRDILGVSHGSILEGSIGHMLNVSEKWKVRASALLGLYDKRYSNYYYGIETFESHDIYPHYPTSTSYITKLTLMVMGKLTSNIDTTFTLGREDLYKTISRSPTLRQNYSYSSFMSLTYTF